jgi:ferric-dicitrate binding protein FerR (iron transport regulator)
MSGPIDRNMLYDLFGQSVDGTLTDADHARLEAMLSADAAARRLWYEFSDLETGLADWAAVEGQSSDVAAVSFRPTLASVERRPSFPWRFAASLAAMLLLSVAAAWWFGPWASSEEPFAGVAVLARAVDVEWSTPGDERSVGAVFGPGTVRLRRGAVQFDFYSGARVVLEGPAEVRLVSSMEVGLIAGRVRAQVPPQAEGFVVDGPNFRVVDRGTEFGVAVAADAAEVHVFQGEVELAAPDQPQAVRTLTAGQAVQHTATAWSDGPANTAAFLNEATIADQESRRAQSRCEAWRAAAEQWDRDPAAVVHFRFDTLKQSDSPFNLGDLTNSVVGAAPSTMGRVVGCEVVQGRWPTSRALQWCGQGDRIRFRSEQPLRHVSFVAWVRVPHLSEGLGSLVCGGGDAVGTMHWEISRAGQLRLAIARDLGRARADWEAVDSRPFLTADRYGQWIQLATTFDGTTVRHYGNGEPIGSGAAFQPPALHLGTADVGNSDGRIVRAFPGAIDEVLILSRVLAPDEVRRIYDEGKP